MNKYRYTLSRGVGLTVVNDKRFKNEYLTVSFMTKLNAEENTLSYILPSLLLRGTEKYPRAIELGRAIQRCYDAEFSGETLRMGNAKVIKFGASYISSDYTRFDITREVAQILKEVILRPLRSENGLLSPLNTELEKKAVTDQIKTLKNNKRAYAFSKCREMMLQGDPCGISKLGTVKSAEKINAESITGFYNRMLNDFALEFFYEGSSDPDNVSTLIKEAFSELINDKRTSLSDLGAFTPPPDVPYFEHSEDTSSEQSILCLGFKMPHTEVGDFTGKLFAEMLSASPVSRLFMNIREKRGLCYFCDLTTIAKKDRAIIECGLEYSAIPEARRAILEEIHDIAQGNISQYEFESAKASLINAYKGVFDSQSAIEGWEISSLLLDKDESPEDVIKKIISISPESISRYASEMELCAVYVLKESE